MARRSALAQWPALGLVSGSHVQLRLQSSLVSSCGPGEVGTHTVRSVQMAGTLRDTVHTEWDHALKEPGQLSAHVYLSIHPPGKQWSVWPLGPGRTDRRQRLHRGLTGLLPCKWKLKVHGLGVVIHDI